MFTQCAKCETVFKLSAEVLRAAGGQVRCGRCGEVFNALARLAEDASAFPTGESPLEMETRADEILHSTMPPALSEAAPREGEDLAAADVEFARLQVLDLELYDDDRPVPPPAGANEAAPRAKAEHPAEATPGEEISLGESSLEFTLPPGELDRIFVEPKRRQSSSTPVIPNSAAPPTGAPRSTAPPRPSPARAATTSDVVQTPNPAQPHASASLDATRALDGAAASAGVDSSRQLGMEVSEDVRRDMLAGFKGRLPEITAPPAPRLPFGVWLGAAIVLALTLAAQLIHENLSWLAAHAPTPANLSAYQLRQWGVTGDPSANGTLRVRASILNTAAQLQPYPLLRVTLANRFGAPLGARDFEPAEYLGKPTVRMLAPGERVDATLNILDPGKDAEGFEIDVCLRSVDQKVVCAGDIASQTKK